MNIKNRLQRLENTSTLKSSKVYIVPMTAEGNYIVNGTEKSQQDFNKFMSARSNSIFIIDDIPKGE